VYCSCSPDCAYSRLRELRHAHRTIQ
jgi:hypothetical protein